MTMLESRYNVPYFCPKCGQDKTSFDSLIALRYHVDTYHFKNSRNPPPMTGYTDPGPPQPPGWIHGDIRRLLENEPSNFVKSNRTPWTGQEKISPATSNRLSAKPPEVTRGVPGDDVVGDTLRHLEGLRKASDKSLAAQREQLERLEERARSKEAQLEKIGREMEKALAEKEALERECSEMRRNQAEDQERLDDIKRDIDDKDRLIEKKEKELKKLREFVQNAAEQESEARLKLEETIEKILERAEKAEEELDQLRRRENEHANAAFQSQEAPVTNQGVDSTGGNRAGDMRDVISGTNVASAAAHNMAAELMTELDLLPAEQRRKLIADVESSDLSPLAEEYIRNFLAYYRALRRSELHDNASPTRRYHDDAGRPMASTRSDHVTAPNADTVFLRFQDNPGGGSSYHPDPGVLWSPGEEGWIERNENPNLSSGVPSHIQGYPVYRPDSGNRNPWHRDPSFPGPRYEDDLNVDSRGIMWDRGPPGKSRGKEEEREKENEGKPLKGIRKRTSESNPSFVRPDFPDSLAEEVTRDWDDAGNSPSVVPERDENVRRGEQQGLEGSTGDSAEDRVTEEEGETEEEEEEEEETDTSAPVPLPRSKETASSSKPEPSADGAVISPEVLVLVFPFLDTLSLCQAAIVCREWRDVSRSPDVWQHVTIKDATVSSKFLITQSKWCSQVKRITLEGLRTRSRHENESQQVFAKKTRGSLEAGFDALLTAAQDVLLSISIVDCVNILTDRCLWQVSCFGRLLQSLAYVSDLDPAGPEVMWALGAGCRDIRHVIIPPKYPSQKPERFNNKCVQVIGRCWPLLLTLTIGGIEVDIRGLLVIAQCCLKLETLELDHMCEMTEETATAMCQHGLKGLANLIFSHTPATPKAVLHFHNINRWYFKSISKIPGHSRNQRVRNGEAELWTICRFKLGSCPHLKFIRLRLDINDYFKNPEDEKSKSDFADILDKLSKVKASPGLDDIVELDTNQ